MTPVEDDPDMLTALARFVRHLAGGLAFTVPFVAPAFVGALLAAARASRRKRGALSLVSVICWSTAAGAALTPLFAHAAHIPDNVAQSCATFVAIIGNEALHFVSRKLLGKEEKEWDGVDRRKEKEQE